MVDNSDILVAFDLDDTLYKECEYVRSGYRYVARRLARELRVPAEGLLEIVESDAGRGRHPFDVLFEYTDGNVSVERMVAMYREHIPFITLPDVSAGCLARLASAGCTLALITDGRHTGQWNKIRALAIERYIDGRLISVSADIGADKTLPLPWERMQELTPGCTRRWYIGDNPRKDFHYPNLMGWNTVMLRDDGRNIKTQHVDLPESYRARFEIDSLSELPPLVMG
ncbi:MAG: HAD family hydrolase [Muribaculaceae bacterium]|nr:HAD family hydrolase [Muribaculaceae bacterium]